MYTFSSLSFPMTIGHLDTKCYKETRTLFVIFECFRNPKDIAKFGIGRVVTAYPIAQPHIQR